MHRGTAPPSLQLILMNVTGDLLCIESFVQWTVVGRTAEVGASSVGWYGEGIMETHRLFTANTDLGKNEDSPPEYLFFVWALCPLPRPTVEAHCIRSLVLWQGV